MTPAQQAELDQSIALFRGQVHALVSTQRKLMALCGRELATADLVAVLHLYDPCKVASLAAVAVTMLAAGDRP